LEDKGKQGGIKERRIGTTISRSVDGKGEGKKTLNFSFAPKGEKNMA